MKSCSSTWRPPSNNGNIYYGQTFKISASFSESFAIVCAWVVLSNYRCVRTTRQAVYSFLANPSCAPQSEEHVKRMSAAAEVLRGTKAGEDRARQTGIRGQTIGNCCTDTTKYTSSDPTWICRTEGKYSPRSGTGSCAKCVGNLGFR